MSKIKVTIEVTSDEGYVSKNSYEIGYASEQPSLNDLAQTILYAIPKQDFLGFDIIQIFKDNKIVGHGE